MLKLLLEIQEVEILLLEIILKLKTSLSVKIYIGFKKI